MPTITADDYKAQEQQFELSHCWNFWWNNVGSNQSLGHYDETTDLANLIGALSGEDVIVVGAGPSLFKNLELLKSSSLKIIAVDRAYETLYRAGIKPYLVVSIDGRADCAKFIAMGEGEPTKFALSIVSHPATFDVLLKRGIKPYHYTQEEEDSFFWGCFHEEESVMAMKVKSGSVVTFIAVDIAVQLGAKTIYTLGNDLGVSLDDKEGIEREVRYNPVLHKSGNMCFPMGFAVAAWCFATYPEKRPGVRFVDCSGGMEKKNWETMEFENLCQIKEGIR